MTIKRSIDQCSSDEDVPEQPITIRRRNIDPSELTPKQLDRVLKNRQAAQASRERKRAYVNDLEASRDALEAEATELRGRVAVLETEKSVLSDQINQLRGEFEQLKALLLSSSQRDPKELTGLLDRCGSTMSRLDPDSKGTRMDLQPTAPPAIPVLHATFSPSIKFSDHHSLERRRLTFMPLSARNHCVTPKLLRPRRTRRTPFVLGDLLSLCPLTLSLLSKRLNGSLMGSKALPRPLMTSSSWTIRSPSMTWASRTPP